MKSLHRFMIALTVVGSAALPSRPVSAAPQSSGASSAAGPSAQSRARKALATLPPAVRSTVEAETRNAVLKGVAREQEHGKTVYEVESLVNGRSRDLMIDAEGVVYEVEEEIDSAAAPAAVRAALQGRGRVERLESVVTHGTTHYEAQLRSRTGKKSSIELDAAGRPLR